MPYLPLWSKKKKQVKNGDGAMTTSDTLFMPSKFYSLSSTNKLHCNHDCPLLTQVGAHRKVAVQEVCDSCLRNHFMEKGDDKFMIKVEVTAPPSHRNLDA